MSTGLSRTTTFAEIATAAVQSALADTYHALPGIVQAYYPATMEADVQIALDDPRFDPASDELEYEPWPVYPHVRVAWPRFGGFTICGPLAKGDKVQVFFQDLDDSDFRATGQQGAPPRTRRHSSMGAFVVPWDLTDAGVAASAGAAATALVIGKDGAEAQIRITGATISLGATGADFVALASKVDACMAAIKTHIHTGGTIGGNTGPSASLAALPATGSTIVKAD